MALASAWGWQYLHFRSPPAYNRAPPAFNHTPPVYNRAPPAYVHTPPACNCTPPAYNRAPLAYINAPPAYSPAPPACNLTPLSPPINSVTLIQKMCHCLQFSYENRKQPSFNLIKSINRMEMKRTH